MLSGMLTGIPTYPFMQLRLPPFKFAMGKKEGREGSGSMLSSVKTPPPGSSPIFVALLSFWGTLCSPYCTPFVARTYLRLHIFCTTPRIRARGFLFARALLVDDECVGGPASLGGDDVVMAREYGGCCGVDEGGRAPFVAADGHHGQHSCGELAVAP